MSRVLIGVVFVAVAVVLDVRSVELVLVTDGHLGKTLRTVHLALRLGSALVGLWILARGLPARVPRPLAFLLLASGLGALSLGAYGRAVAAGWAYRAPVPLAELCELVRDDPGSILSPKQLARVRERYERVRAKGARFEHGAFWCVRLAELLTANGRPADALDVLEDELSEAEARGASADARVRLWRELGVVHLRLGEVAHCLEHHNPARCVYPIAGVGRWTDSTPAAAAIRCFEEVLRLEPEDPSARWLLHLARGTVGLEEGGAETAPEPYGAAADTQLRPFRDLAPALGIAGNSVLGGAVLDDFDGDGLLDVMTSSYDPCEALRLWRNVGDGTFTDVTESAGLANQWGGFNLAQADYDGDGRLDVLVLRGGWMRGPSGRQRNSLLHQEPDGFFRDVTAEAGLSRGAFPCQVGEWADFDGDGDLDVFVGNEGAPNQLFRNEGDGTFTEVAAQAGVRTEHLTKGAAWGDYDDDGDVDLYVSNNDAPNELYRNEGDGTFTECARALGVDLSEGADLHTFPTWFFDYDNDGHLDLFVGGYELDRPVAAIAADLWGEPSDASRLHLFRGDGGGRFEDVTEQVGLSHVRFPMGANYGDIDGDGFADIYLGTGAPGFDFLVPNTLYRNDGGRRFVDATAGSGLGHLQKGHAIAFGDIDNDGDQDILAQIGGFYRADAFPNALFENPGTPNRWITLLLEGGRANRFAIDARVEVRVRGAAGQRSIHALARAGACFGGSSLQQEIGLGAAEAIEWIEVRWPGGGAVQRFPGPPVNHCVALSEGQPGFRLVARERVTLSR